MADDKRFAFMEARQEFERAAARLKVGDDAALDAFDDAVAAMRAAAFDCFASEARKAGRAEFSERLALLTREMEKYAEHLKAWMSSVRTDA